MPDEQNRSLRLLLRMRNRFGHSQQRSRSRPIVIRAIANRIGRARRADADVIVVRANRDVFILQNRVAAFPNCDDVLRHGMFAFDSDGDSDVLRSEFERRHIRAISERDCVNLLTFEQGLRHLY